VGISRRVVISAWQVNGLSGGWYCVRETFSTQGVARHPAGIIENLHARLLKEFFRFRIGGARSRGDGQ
jgi:hypothetical protein